MKNLDLKRQPKRRTWGATLRRIAARSLTITPEEVRVYAPREVDLLIAEAMIGGAVTQHECAQYMKVTDAIVTRALKDLTACAWISQTVRQHMAFRLGNVDTMLYAKCLEGNVRAIELFYKQFGGIQNRSLNINVDVGGFDPSQLADADLDKIIASKLRGTEEAEFEVVGESNPSKDSAPTGD